jgi:hypothetical protein
MKFRIKHNGKWFLELRNKSKSKSKYKITWF